MKLDSPIHGSLLGTALGDSLGLPSEGMSRSRIAKRWPAALSQRLLGGRGMVSDDTEHAFFTASALARCGGSSVVFQKHLARRLRWWLVCLPAGIGWATARAIFKLWLGLPPGKSGVASAGNGPVMRAPLLGACFPLDEPKRREFVTASTILTHTDPRALQASLMAAEAAAFAARGETDIAKLLDSFDRLGTHAVWSPLLLALRDRLGRSASVADYAVAIGCAKSVSGYAPLSTAVALYAWLRHRHDFSRIITETIHCGGDTDTVAAIAGGIAGAEAKSVSVPKEWVKDLRDYPLTVGRLHLMADALAATHSGQVVSPPDPAILFFVPRNFFFLLIVLAHGFRRLLPLIEHAVTQNVNKHLGCLFGLAVGDALGTTLEFSQPGSFAPLTDMVGGGPFHLKPGQWTDDTSMALCLAESLLECQDFNPEDQARRYLKWRRQGYLSSNGCCFDIGATVSDALRRFERNGEPFSGSTDPYSAGNGSLMRLAPVPMFYASDALKAVELSGESSRTTHQAKTCLDACRYAGGIIVAFLNGASKEVGLSTGFHPRNKPWQVGELCPEIAAIAEGSFKTKQPPHIRGSGYVVASLEAALWAFHESTTFEGGALLAVNLGEDADTTGAIYGQIAGAYYGFDAIPIKWTQKIALAETIRHFASRLSQGSMFS